MGPSVVSARSMFFELQFHTEESFDFKMNVAHSLYEIFRATNDPEKKVCSNIDVLPDFFLSLLPFLKINEFITH